VNISTTRNPTTCNPQLELTTPTANSLNFPKVTYTYGKAVGKIGDTGKKLHWVELLESASVFGTDNRQLPADNRQIA
jgi:hypothetical protein